jgi:hypothetical protein
MYKNEVNVSLIIEHKVKSFIFYHIICPARILVLRPIPLPTSIRRLLFQWASTVKIQLSMLI